MTRSWIRLGVFSVAMFLASSVANVWSQDATKPADVKPANNAPAAKAPNEVDELALKQSRLADKYNRLEELLSKLSNFEAASNPRRAALLKQALGQSKERLTLSQLNKVVALLNQRKLDNAVDGQNSVDKDLKALLELLQSENRADRLKSEQARIREYIKEVERLLRLERGIQGQTEGGADTKQLSDEQKKVAERTGELAKKIQENEEGGQAKSSDGKSSDNAQDGEKKDGAKDGDKNNKNGDKKDADKKDGDKKDADAKDGDKKPSGDMQPGENKSDSKSPNGDSKDGDKKSGDPSGDKKDGDKKDGDKDKGDKDKKDGDKKDTDKKDGNKKDGQKPDSKDDKKPDGDKKQDGQKQDGSKQDGSKQDGQKQDGQKSQQQQNQPQQGGGDQKDQQAQKPQDKQQDNPARKRIQAAEERMKEAERKLAEAKRKEAIEEQEKAKEELEKAKAALEEILRQMREEEVERTLAALEGRFRKMLEMQLKVYESTKRLDKIPVKDRGDEVAILSGRLGSDERKIAFEADKALNLLREEGSSIALPETVEQMREDMEQVAERLDRTKVDTVTQNIEEDIISALEEIIEALQKAQQDQENKKQQQQQQQQGQQQDQPLVDKIAELKMIRSLQLRVNGRTKRYARLLENEDDPVGQTDDKDLRQAIQKLGEREDSIQRITRDIVLGKNK